MSEIKREIKRRNGFTLLELLVSMSMITIIVAVSLTVIDWDGGQRSVSRAVDVLGDAIRVTRTQAIMNGSSARLLVNFDETDEERYLRFLGIMVKETDGSGNWSAVDRGSYLPAGCYVVPRTDVGIEFVDWGSTETPHKGVCEKERDGDLAEYNYVYPFADPVAEGSGPKWLVWQFGPDGRLEVCGGTGGAPVKNYFVVGEGNRDGASKIVFSNDTTAQGLGVKLTGALFRINEVAYYEKKLDTKEEPEASETK